MLKAKGEGGLLGWRCSMSKGERYRKCPQAQGDLYIENTGEEGAEPGCQGQGPCTSFIKAKSRQGGKDAHRKSYRLLSQGGPW